MLNEVIKIVLKNKKAILSVVIGGVVILTSSITGFNIDRAIKSMKLDYEDTISEYKNVLIDVENKLANEKLNALQKAQLEEAKQHCIQKISELELHSKKEV